MYRHIVHILVVILSYTYTFDHISFFFLSLIHSFIFFVVRQFIYMFVCSFICSLIHSFIHPSIYSFIHSFIHLFTVIVSPQTLSECLYSFFFPFVLFLPFFSCCYFFSFCVFFFLSFSFLFFVCICFLIICLLSILSQVLWLEQQTLKSYQLYSNLNVQFDDPSVGLQWYIVSYRSYKSLKQCLMISFQRGFFKTIIFKVKM